MTQDQGQNDILSALKGVMDPDLHRDIVDLGFVQNIVIDGGDVRFDIELTTPACPVKDLMKAQAETCVKKLSWVKTVTINMTAQVRAALEQTADLKIKNIIAVASGKGGVGKSTVAVNLAFALKETGASVGILDADIYGPSIPLMLDMMDAQPMQEQKNGKMVIKPIERDGVRLMSMGFLTPAEKPTIWRGPMIHGVLKQFLNDVDWGELDYLIIDLPPGTGDAQLTMVQSANVSGAVVVTTPQDVAMIDAVKAYNMFTETNVPILGIVENMSGYLCTECGHEAHIFGQGGAKKWAETSNTRFLGGIPINIGIRVQGDEGTPAVVTKGMDESVLAAFRHVAEQTAAAMATQQMSQVANAGPLSL